MRRNPRRGTAILAVVPGPGRLVLSGGQVHKAGKRTSQAGKVTLPIRARGGSLGRLRRRGRARLALAIAFTPDGGSALVKHKKVTLVKRFH